LLGGDLVPLHEDAFSLADQLPGNQGFAELTDLLGIRERHRGVRRDECPDLFGLAIEGVRALSVEVQGTDPIAFDEQLE
jgi:hypothetical protein